MSKKIIVTVISILAVLGLIVGICLDFASKVKYPPTHWDPTTEEATEYSSIEIEGSEIKNLISQEANFINKKYSVDLKVPDFKVYKMTEATPKDDLVAASYCNGDIYLFPLYFASTSQLEHIAHEGIHLLFHANYGFDTYFAEKVGKKDFYGIKLEEAYADLISRDFMRECYPEEILSKIPAYRAYTVQIEGLDYALGLATAKYFVSNDFSSFVTEINNLAKTYQQTTSEEDGLDPALLFSAMIDNSISLTAAGAVENDYAIVKNLRFIARCIPKSELSALESILLSNGITLNAPIEYLTHD
jgi:hypothetical protein